MVQNLALKLTQYAIEHQWIRDSDVRWCQYAIEKHLSTLLFVAVCLIFAMSTGTILNTLVFILVFFIFRRRMGGWHTKHFWTCQLVSIGTVVMAVILVGPWLEQINPYIFIMADAFVILWMWKMKPNYCDSAHFTKEIQAANNKQKVRLLVDVVVFQVICFRLEKYSLLIYIFLGLTIAALSVMLEYFKKRMCQI